MSVKIVPIVALPVLLLVAARSGKRRLVNFLVGNAVVLAILWLPVFVRRWTPFKADVLGFKGYTGQWGLVEFATLAHFSKHSVQTLQNSGRSLLLVLAAGIPFLVVWRRKDATIPAFGLSLVLVLLLSTATAGRYTVWAVAAAFLINFWAAAIYDIAVRGAAARRLLTLEPWSALGLGQGERHAVDTPRGLSRRRRVVRAARRGDPGNWGRSTSFSA